MLSFTPPSPASVPASARNRAEQILVDLPQALIVLLPDRRVVFANGNAERLFGKGQASRVAERLMGVGQLDAGKIAELLRLAASGQTAQAGLWFAPGLNTGWLNVSTLAPSIAGSADWPADCLLLLVQIDEPGLTQTARIDALCKQCRLTNTERYVLMLLADGFAVEAAARQLELQVSTIRTHIRNLLGKTRAPSLMQLTRWLGSAGGLLQ